jgi:dTDP-4-amino-4,6-dideoxygalactose transaminase
MQTFFRFMDVKYYLRLCFRKIGVYYGQVKKMANIKAILQALQLEHTEENRSILMRIVDDYESNLAGLSPGLEDNQKYLLDFIRNHPDFEQARSDDDSELVLGYQDPRT